MVQFGAAEESRIICRAIFQIKTASKYAHYTWLITTACFKFPLVIAKYSISQTMFQCLFLNERLSVING